MTLNEFIDMFIEFIDMLIITIIFQIIFGVIAYHEDEIIKFFSSLMKPFDWFALFCIKHTRTLIGKIKQ